MLMLSGARVLRSNDKERPGRHVITLELDRISGMLLLVWIGTVRLLENMYWYLSDIYSLQKKYCRVRTFDKA
jgi:hypothetical protein